MKGKKETMLSQVVIDDKSKGDEEVSRGKENLSGPHLLLQPGHSPSTANFRRSEFGE